MTMTPTRRALLGGGLAAAAWGLGRRPCPVPFARCGRLSPVRSRPLASRPCAAPGRGRRDSLLRWSDARPAAAAQERRRIEIKVEERLAEPTALAFPGLRAANSSAGYGGLTGPRLAPGRTADIRFAPPDAGFNLYLPHAGSTDAGQQGRGLFGPIVVEEAETPDIDQDVAIVLSDWSIDEKGRIRDDFSDPAFARAGGRKGGLVFANAGPAPLNSPPARARACA